MKKRRENWEEVLFQFQDSWYSYTNQDCVVFMEGRHKDLWNRIEYIKIAPHKYSQLNFDKGAKVIRWRKNILSVNGAGATGYLWAKKTNKQTLDLNLFIQNGSSLNVKCRTVNILAENTGECLQDLGLVKYSWMWHQMHNP